MPKNQIKKVTQKKEVVVAPSNRKAVFAGAQSLMSAPKDEKGKHARQLILIVSESLKISPFGVNILGDLPYTNNMGRKEKLAEYNKDAQFEYKWVKYAEDDTSKAICECRLVSKGKPLCGWVVGECSPKTIKMSTLNGYQNHLAQTRAENRAFEAAYGSKMRIELFANIQKLRSGGVLDDDTAAKALSAGNTSAEEAVDMKATSSPVSPVKVENGKISDEEFAKVKRMVNAMGDMDALETSKKKIQDSPRYTATQKKELVTIINERIEGATIN